MRSQSDLDTIKNTVPAWPLLRLAGDSIWVRSFDLTYGTLSAVAVAEDNHQQQEEKQ